MTPSSEYQVIGQGCKVAVVGGAGFLGSHLVQHLIEDRGCEVVILDNLVSGRREFLHPQAQFLYHDITGEESLTYRIFRDCQIEYVFNYAACPYIPVSFDRPLYVTNINAFGAIKVLNAAQEAGVRGILQVSSAEIYGGGYQHFSAKGDSTTETRLREDCPVQPHSTYGVSKAMVDFYVQSRWKEVRTPAIALRQFNCMGERETHPYVITEILSQLYRGNGCEISLGNDSHRDFLYAGDAVRMAVRLLERGRFGEVYNLGSETSISIYHLARQVAFWLGFGNIRVIEDDRRKRPWEIWHLRSDNTKIEGVCGKLSPRVSLQEMVCRTAEYFQSNGKKWCWEK